MKIAGKFFFIVCFLFFTTAAMAGITGKITGYVKDAETGDPLPGANIIMEGTTMGAASDLEGYFVIINIPPGTYTLKASMIGYQAQRMEKVRVSIDLTTTVNFSLRTQVVDLGGEVTVVAEREIVQKDMTSSLSAVSADEIKGLPVQEMGDVLELQAGLVKDPVGGLHVRGGRSGEVAYWIDGIAATDVYSGNLGVQVENASIQELQVVSGTFNAEYGQAMSGIVNIVTKEGGKDYHGEIRYYMGDYVTDRTNIFDHLDYINPLSVANLQGNLSGPIPFLKSKLHFFSMIRYFKNEGWFYGRKRYLPTGYRSTDEWVSLNPFRKISSQIKVSYNLTSMMKLTYGLFWNDNKFRNYDHSFKYNPEGDYERFETGRTHIVSLNHVLSPRTFYELKFTDFYTDYQQYVFKNPYQTVRYIPNPADTSGNTFIIDPNSPLGYVHPDSLRDPVSYSFKRAGTKMDHFFRSTGYRIVKFDLVNQWNKAHQFKAGIELRRHELNLEWFNIQPKRKGNTEIVPFQPYVPDVTTPYHDKYTHRPLEFAAYLQDKIELKDMIVNIGVRFDYFEPDGVVLADPKDPNIFQPQLAAHKYYDPDLPEPQLDDASNIIPLAERRKFWYKDATAKYKVSPRLGIAYPITSRGVIHFSYGHFFQIPLFNYLYSSPDFKVTEAEGSRIIGNADLRPQKTVMYEIGLQQQIADDVGIDVTMFYRDVRDWVGTSPLIDTYGSVKYSRFENKDYSNVRGFTLSLNKRYSHYFSASVDYSFMIADGSHSNPADAYFAENAQREPQRQLIPMSWDRRHTLNGSLGVGTQKWRVSFLGRFWSGMPYTPRFPKGTVTGGGVYNALRDNSDRLPNQYSFDMYFNYAIKISNFNANIFVNIYNIFDTPNATWVWTDTGSPDYTLDALGISGDPKRVGSLEEFFTHPEWYTEPRQVQLGLAFNF
ncbi:MAG: TonB-dependent receptor [Calditrichaeota bacterium]|nr:TonB-dependent receptor [Calditrichota bacterium]